MRLGNLLTSMALIVSTLTLSSAQSYHPFGTMQQVRAQVSDCCCAPAKCDCHKPCLGSGTQPAENSVAAPTLTGVTHLPLPAVSGAAAQPTPRLAPTIRLLSQETITPTPDYAVCLANRAPPNA